MPLQAGANGTMLAATLSDGAEHNFFSDAVENLAWHMIKVNLKNMVGTDKIEIRIYDYDLVEAGYEIFDLLTYEGPQTNAKIMYVPPLPQHRYQVSIKQVIADSATYKAFNWERLTN